jgi:hypothetical protein
VLLRNYEMDQVGQAEVDALAQARADISMYENLIAFTKNLINSQAMVTTDDQGIATLIQNPPPPPPPPPVEAGSAPAPPEIVSGAILVRRYEDALLETEARADELVLELADCFAKDRTSGVVCGLSSNEAPYPWSALGNGKCRGYDTLSTREGDYCGYCEPVAIQTGTPRAHACPFLLRAGESDVNPLAADSKLRKELLSVGPFCFDADDKVLYCSPNASRTQRSGVTDVDYMKRPDRRYWLVCCNLNHPHPPTHTHTHTHTHTCTHTTRVTHWPSAMLSVDLAP